jgi:putative DNA primase/helicase
LVKALGKGLALSDLLHGTTERLGAAEGQERRAARTFALCGVAGELAEQWGVVPWPAGAATEAAAHAFDLWRKRRGGSGNSAEHGSILRAISDFIDRHADSRFSSIDGSADIIRDRAGFWKTDAGRRLFLFTSGGLRDAVKGYDLDRALKALGSAQAIVATDPGRSSKTTRTPDGRTPRLYHIDPDKLASEHW